MDDFGFTPGWSKMTPTGKTNRAASIQPPLPPEIPPFFNQPLPNQSVESGKGDRYYGINVNPDSGYYGGQYAGFPHIGGHQMPRGGGIPMRGRGRGMYAPVKRVGTFPRKNHTFGYSGRGGMMNQSYQAAKKAKPYSSAGKTAAMILNELYPDFKDQCAYETLMTATKMPRFKCSFTVQGILYEAEGSSKKIAKQLACEKALKDLRPDIQLDVPSFEQAEAEKKAAVMAQPRRTESAENGNGKASSKKKKSDPLKTSNSLHDYFLRLCREREAKGEEKFNPEFSFAEVPSMNSSKPHLKRFQCTLVMAEQGKVYTHEGVGKAAGKNAVIRKALLEVFNVTQQELKAVERRAISLRPGNPVQVLLQALSFYDRPMRIDVDTADEKPVEANSRFVAKITLDNDKTIVGPPEESKQKAKDAAALKVLTEELELSMPSEEEVSLKRAATVLSPCYALHALMLKQNRNVQPDLKYSDAEDISEGPSKPPSFKCVLTVNGKDTFEGIGQSKRAAKSAAAEKALVQLFKFDMLAENAMDTLSVKRARTDEALDFCVEICSMVRTEYENICHQQGCPLTTQIAAFVLVSPEGEKTMVSLGAGRNAIIDGRHLASSQGTVLVHMQSIVLARRGFNLYLHKQLEQAGSPDSVVERSPTSNKYRLKSGYKVVLYSSFPPDIPVRHAPSGGQHLCCYTGNGMQVEKTPDKVQTFEEMVSSGKVNVMSVADKMLKWNYMGVQGALLSYLIEPVFISNYCIAAPTNDRAVMNAILLRFGDARKDELTVKSAQEGVTRQGEMYHNWVAGIGTMERLDPSTGRTVTGSPSRLSKSEMFESWSRALNAVGGIDVKPMWSCADAKSGESVYMSALTSFITQLKNLGLGEWHRKGSKIDDFALVSFDE